MRPGLFEPRVTERSLAARPPRKEPGPAPEHGHRRGAGPACYQVALISTRNGPLPALPTPGAVFNQSSGPSSRLELLPQRLELRRELRRELVLEAADDAGGLEPVVLLRRPGQRGGPGLDRLRHALVEAAHGLLRFVGEERDLVELREQRLVRLELR